MMRVFLTLLTAAFLWWPSTALGAACEFTWTVTGAAVEVLLHHGTNPGVYPDASAPVAVTAGMMPCSAVPNSTTPTGVPHYAVLDGRDAAGTSLWSSPELTYTPTGSAMCFTEEVNGAPATVCVSITGTGG